MQFSKVNELNIFTIVLNWNNLHDTSETIQCLLNQDVINHKIILVDNNSEENIRTELKTRFPNLIFIDNDSNIGYTGGNNVGIRYALVNGADIIIIANNDIDIEDKELISKAVSIFNSCEKISILGPSLHYFSHKNQVQEEGTTFFYAKRDKLLLNDYMVEDRNIRDNLKLYDGATGAFLMVKKEVFKSIGLFDEKIFMYGDETDFCYRAWVNGFFIAIASQLIVYHKAPINKGILKPYISYYKTRNSLYFLKKHKRTIQNYKYFRNRFFRDVLSLIVNYIKSYKEYKDLLFATLRGVIDGMLFRMGNRF